MQFAFHGLQPSETAFLFELEWTRRSTRKNALRTDPRCQRTNGLTARELRPFALKRIRTIAKVLVLFKRLGVSLKSNKRPNLARGDIRLDRYNAPRKKMALMDHEGSSAAQELKARVHQEGWAWISAGAGIDLGGLARTLGLIVSPRTGGGDRKLLRPYSTDRAPPYSMSAVTGTGPQPMHTDCAYLPCPPRYVMLACVSPGESECRTRLWVLDWSALLACPDSGLCRPGWIVRGGGRYPAFYAQVLNRSFDGQPFIRFDPCCMTPPNHDKPAIREVSNTLEACANPQEISWVRGSAVLFDNWRCLHGRGFGAERAPGRRLERWLIGG
jgi:hypothetical protein